MFGHLRITSWFTGHLLRIIILNNAVVSLNLWWIPDLFLPVPNWGHHGFTDRGGNSVKGIVEPRKEQWQMFYYCS